MFVKPEGFEDLARRMWGDKVLLGIVSHTLGGIGIGLLACKGKNKKTRRIALGLVGFSALAKTYAILNMRLGTEEPEKKGPAAA